MPKWLRLVVVGGNSVGKTALIHQAVYKNHVTGRPMFKTIEDVYEVLIEVERGIKERFRIYDTMGLDESKGEISKHYMNLADGFLLVYSTTSKRSFLLVQSLKRDIEKSRGRDFPVVVIGTKTDLKEERECDCKVASQWADAEKVRLCEVCVGERRSLQEPFSVLAKKMAASCGKSYLQSTHSDVKRIFSMRKGPKGLSLSKDSNLDST